MMMKSDRLVKRNAQQVCMTLTGLFLLGLQTPVVLLVVASLLSVVVVVLVVGELSVEDVQDPLKGSVFGCDPNMTVFLRAGSKNAVLLLAGSWA
jgi:hypothetical protein